MLDERTDYINPKYQIRMETNKIFKTKANLKSFQFDKPQF